MGAWSEGMEWVHGLRAWSGVIEWGHGGRVVSFTKMVVALVLFNKEVVSSVLL